MAGSEHAGCSLQLRPDIPGTIEAAQQGGWAMHAHSRYLAGLPGSCGGCPLAATLAQNDSHMTMTPQGLHLQYQLSAGAVVLLSLLHCTVRSAKQPETGARSSCAQLFQDAAISAEGWNALKPSTPHAQLSFHLLPQPIAIRSAQVVPPKRL